MENTTSNQFLQEIINECIISLCVNTNWKTRESNYIEIFSEKFFFDHKCE